MQMVVERDELLRAAGQVGGIPAAKSEVPILSHLVLRADRDSGTLRGTDHDMEVTAPFKATVTELGQICVRARLLADIVKRMPEGQPISLTLAGDVLRVVCGKSKFQLATLSADDYPSFSASSRSKTHPFEIEADRLRAMLNGVRHAMGREETRHYLCGVHLHVTAEEPVLLKAVATNGHLLALESCAAPVGAYGMPAIILPAATVAEMVKLLPDSAQLVTLTVGTNFLWLDLPGGLSLGSKLIEGRYPDYGRVIPQHNPHRLSVDAERLSVALDRVGTLCGGDWQQVVLFVNPKGVLRVSTERREIGSASDVIETAEVAGAKAAIGVNRRYLGDILRSFAGGVVEIRYSTAADPLLITLADSSRACQVLMPMRADVSEVLDEAA